MGAESKSDVCQTVNVEHFFLEVKIQNGRREIKFFVNNSKNISLRPYICIEHEYKYGYCRFIGVKIMALSYVVSVIWTFHYFIFTNQNQNSIMQVARH